MKAPNPLPFYEIERSLSQNNVTIENQGKDSGLWIYIGFFSLVMITCIGIIYIDNKYNESKSFD